MTASRDAYSTLKADDRTRIAKPEYNNSDESMKTSLFNGAGWYIPSERRWETYNEHFELPRLTRRDAVDFQSEKDFVNFLKRRDIPNYKKITAYYPSHPPSVKWNSHFQTPSSQSQGDPHHRTSRIPKWDEVGYYGYYQEILDRMKIEDCRRLSPSGMTGYPHFTHQTYY
ncbi:unnamed protein product [Heterobilharzia americana]|nr:unnamed protein product [Heterobilharzia americana]CAH8464333.1 unnamed protein product [Heterobilharzia americana]